MEWWILIFVFLGILYYLVERGRNEKEYGQTKMNFSDRYIKQQKKVDSKSWMVFLGITLLIISFFILLFGFLITGKLISIGIILITFGIFFIVYYYSNSNFKKDREKLEKMYKEEEKRQMYENELIKEKARLNARK